MSELAKLEKELSPLENQVNTLDIVDSDSFMQAGSYLKACKDAQKRIKKFFEPIRTKAHAAWKEVCKQEKEHLQQFKDAEATLKAKMLEYKSAKEEERKAEEAKLQEAADKEGVPVVIRLDSGVPKVEGVHTVERWKARVVDPERFVRAAIDNNYLMPFIVIDEARLNRVAQATKGQVQYPGVKFYKEKSLSSRGTIL